MWAFLPIKRLLCDLNYWFGFGQRYARKGGDAYAATWYPYWDWQ